VSTKYIFILIKVFLKYKKLNLKGRWQKPGHSEQAKNPRDVSHPFNMTYFIEFIFKIRKI
jgi:hypothetical protein